jgi:hypothetical protein
MEWRSNLESTLRRLEIALPHIGKIPSVVIHSADHVSIQQISIGGLIPLTDPITRIKAKNSARPYHLIAFDVKRKGAEILLPLLLEMSYVLDEIYHPLLGGALNWDVVPPSEPLKGGLVSWLVVMHRFGHRLPETDVMSAEDGQPRDWNLTENLATLIDNTANASARFANWILKDTAIKPVIDRGNCPVQLVGRDKPPVLYGTPLGSLLTSDQYDLIAELIHVFPDGLKDGDFQKIESTKNIESPRHALQRMRGEYGRNKAVTAWTDVILPPGSKRLGFRLKPT